MSNDNLGSGLEWLEEHAELKVADLLPCPFCGEDTYKSIEHTHNAYWWAKCEQCGAQVDSDYNPRYSNSRSANVKSIDRAIEMWNTRNGVKSKRK